MSLNDLLDDLWLADLRRSQFQLSHPTGDAMKMKYITSDGTEFDDHGEAQQHQALVDKIIRWMDAEGIGETRRRGVLQRTLRWMDFHAQTADEPAP